MQSFVLGLLTAGLPVVVAFLFLLFYRRTGRVDSRQEVNTLYNTLQQRIDSLQNQLRINLDGNTQLIQQQVAGLTKQIDDRLGQNARLNSETGRQVNERLDNAARFFADLQNRLGSLSEANEKIYKVGLDITSLKEILRSPKARGTLGEFLLRDILGEMLPFERFEMQYSFKSGEKVDAIIRVGGQLIPVDSKFPLENFRRLIERPDDNSQKEESLKGFRKQFIADVKKHVDSISKKYILPEEGTFDFAFMYIPAENVFYEVISRSDGEGQEESLQTYAVKKRVIPVSPNSFYAYLSALMHALRGERMQKNIFEILAQMRHLNVDLSKFRGDFDKVGFHLNNLRRSFEDADKRLGRYEDRLGKMHEAEPLPAEEKPAVKLIS